MEKIRSIVLSACCVAVLACGHRDPEAPGSSAPLASPTNSPTASLPATGDQAARPEPGDTSEPTFKGITSVAEKKPLEMPPVVLREVRTGRHENFDRVVFEFVGNAVPGYHIEYVDKPVRSCGSGDVVQVAGEGFLIIQMMPANAHTEAGEATVKERTRVLNLPVIKEMKLICDFEADVQWVLGVSSPNRYRVLELSNPARLVVDIRHSSGKSEVRGQKSGGYSPDT